MARAQQFSIDRPGKSSSTTALLLGVLAPVFAAAGGFLYAPAEPGRFDAAWEAALLIFGLHLVLLGAAVIRTADAPTFIGALVVIAGAGYSADAVSAALSPHAPLALGEFTFVGEIVLMVWLIGWAARGRSRAPLELADTSG